MKMTRKWGIGVFLGFGIFVALLMGASALLHPQVSVAENVYSCPSWITLTKVSAIPRWALTDCVYQDETQSGGDTNIYVTVKDSGGSPLSGISVHQAWPEGDISQTTIGGTTSFAMGPSNCNPDAGRPGALTIYIENRSISDAVTGMCLPLNRHVRFFLTFQKVTSPPLTPGTPPPTEIPGDYVTHAEFRKLLIDTLIDILTKGR